MVAVPASKDLEPSSQKAPCPLCGRTKDGDCRIGSDLVLCHYGTTHHPPDGMKRGEVQEGSDGQRWAFTGNTTDGRAAIYRLDRPMAGSSSRVIPIQSRRTQEKLPTAAAQTDRPIALAMLREPGPRPPLHPERREYRYSPTQEARRSPQAKGMPHHLIGETWRAGAGPDPWPFFGEADALDAVERQPGTWVLVVEGEPCTELARAGGAAAITPPGHRHSPDVLTPTLERLKDAGAGGLVVLADNDLTGTRRAAEVQKAADGVGLATLLLPATEVWPDLPAKGSLDDAIDRGTSPDKAVAEITEALLNHPGDSRQPQQGAQSEPELRPYSELVADALAAIRAGDENEEMFCRAELKQRFRVSDEQISTALFKRHSLEQLNPKPQAHDSVDLRAVPELEYLLDGHIPRGDVVLTYGPAGTGKTTLALAKANAYIRGKNLLDRDTPCEPGKVLFIATDSGPAALKKAMHDLDMDPDSDPLLQPGHPEQRLWVWAHEPEQGHRAWIADIHGVIRLEQFIRAKGITYVVIDSAKAVSSAAGWSYTSNESVKALLQYLREGVAMPTGCCLEFLSHDGTEKGSHSGAKAWAEDPSMVCALELVYDSETQQPIGVKAQFKKDRAAHITPRRSLTYSLVDGELKLHPDQEVVGSCTEAILTILWEAHQRGIRSVSASELRAEASIRFKRSHKTVENTLGKITGTGKGPKPTPVIRPRRGQYALAPAEIERRSLGSNRGGGEMGGVNTKSIAAQGVCLPPYQTPTGGTGGLQNPRPTPMGEAIGGCQIADSASDLGQSPPGEGTAPPLGALVELRIDSGEWDPGWAVAHIESTPIGPRLRVEKASDFRVVSPDQLRVAS